MSDQKESGLVDKAVSGFAMAALSVGAVRAAKSKQKGSTKQVEDPSVLANGYYEGSKTASPLVRKLDAFQKRTPWAGFLYGVVKKFGEDKAGYLAALVAYFGFFSIFPLLIAMVSTLGFVLEGRPELREDIAGSAFDQIPIVGSTLSNTIDDISGSGIILAFGIVAALWSGLKVVDAAQNAMNDVWDLPRVEKENIIVKRARGVVTLVFIFFGLIGGIVISAIANLLPEIPGFGQVLIAIGTIALNMGLYTILFKILTAEDRPWSAHLPGGCLAGFFWWAMQNFGVVYLTRVEESAGPTYGTFASTIVLLTFIFISAQLIILSAEVSVVKYRMLWPRALPKCEITDADRRAWQTQAAATRQVPGQKIISEV